MRNLLFVLAIALASCSSEESDPKPEVYVTCAEMKADVQLALKAADDHRKIAKTPTWQAEQNALEEIALKKSLEYNKRKC